MRSSLCQDPTRHRSSTAAAARRPRVAAAAVQEIGTTSRDRTAGQDPFGVHNGQPAAVRHRRRDRIIDLSPDRQELVCSVIGLVVKLGLVVVSGVSLYRLAGAYQERMERHGEIAAVLELEAAKLAKARSRLDRLFGVEGEQRLIREQSQWIAPDRLRVVWRDTDAYPTVETADAGKAKAGVDP